MLIPCDEPGCEEPAVWQVCYESVEGYSCDAHLGSTCNPDVENTVICLN